MKNTLSVFTRKEVLDYAYKIERVDINEFVVTYNREDVSLDVRYKRVLKGFSVCLDIRVLGPHSFWVQGGIVADDTDKIFWSELSDREFDMREANSEDFATQCREATEVLAQGFPD